VAEHFEARLDLLSRAVHEHEVHAERGEQVQIVREVEEAAVRYHVTAKRNDEDLAAERVDIGGDRLEPVDKSILARKSLTTNGLRVCTGCAARTILVFACDGALLLARGAVRNSGFELRTGVYVNSLLEESFTWSFARS
jgi:hypothetical protein